MSEEIKLLPCQYCGGDLVDTDTPDSESFVVFCHTCEASGPVRPDIQWAIDDWNSTPRALTWTTEPPKVEGLYYQRWNWDGHWGDADVITVEQRSVDKIRKNADRQWAGPIPTPMPKEPRP